MGASERTLRLGRLCSARLLTTNQDPYTDPKRDDLDYLIVGLPKVVLQSFSFAPHLDRTSSHLFFLHPPPSPYPRLSKWPSNLPFPPSSSSLVCDPTSCEPLCSLTNEKFASYAIRLDRCPCHLRIVAFFDLGLVPSSVLDAISRDGMQSATVVLAKQPSSRCVSTVRGARSCADYIRLYSAT